MRTISKIWNSLGDNDKLVLACMALYASLYGIVGIAECVGRAIALALM